MKNSHKAALVAALAVASAADAQVFKDSLASKILGETVKLSIYLPKNYGAKPDAKFPVVYLLDADINMGYFAPMTEFQARSYRDRGQNYIVVGIDTKNRTMNYTPTKSQVADPSKNGKILFADSGGADKFEEFLLRELKPKISAGYRTDGFSVLDGHSFGGLLAADILVRHPEYFQAYIALDPSLWWDKSYILKVAAKQKPQKNSAKPYVFLATAGQKVHGHGFGAGEPDAVPVFENYLKMNNYPYKIVDYPDESHGSVAYKANFDALRAIYEYRNGAAKSMDNLKP